MTAPVEAIKHSGELDAATRYLTLEQLDQFNTGYGSVEARSDLSHVPIGLEVGTRISQSSRLDLHGKLANQATFALGVFAKVCEQRQLDPESLLTDYTTTPDWRSATNRLPENQKAIFEIGFAASAQQTMWATRFESSIWGELRRRLITAKYEGDDESTAMTKDPAYILGMLSNIYARRHEVREDEIIFDGLARLEDDTELSSKAVEIETRAKTIHYFIRHIIGANVILKAPLQLVNSTYSGETTDGDDVVARAVILKIMYQLMSNRSYGDPQWMLEPVEETHVTGEFDHLGIKSVLRLGGGTHQLELSEFSGGSYGTPSIKLAINTIGQ